MSNVNRIFVAILSFIPKLFFRRGPQSKGYADLNQNYAANVKTRKPKNKKKTARRKIAKKHGISKRRNKRLVTCKKFKVYA